MEVHLNNTRWLQCLHTHAALSYISLSFFCPQQGDILEKLRICSMPRFVQFLHDSLVIKKDSALVVTNMHFGTIPVRLFQPKAVSSKLQRGIIFYHGGGTLFGSLSEQIPCGMGEEGPHNRWSLSHIPMRGGGQVEIGTSVGEDGLKAWVHVSQWYSLHDNVFYYTLSPGWGISIPRGCPAAGYASTHSFRFRGISCFCQSHDDPNSRASLSLVGPL